MRDSSKGRWILAALVVLPSLALAVWAATAITRMAGEQGPQDLLTHQVGRSDMLISIIEDGNVESASNVDVTCQVAGGSTILWLVADGTLVEKDAELVRLDSAAIEDQINLQQIICEKAQATMVQAEKEFAAAKIAVQEYIEGTYVIELQKTAAQITIALENLRNSENMLEHLQRMARKGYVTMLQRDAQAFAVERSKLDLQSAELAKTVLEKFTRAKMLEELESARDTAEARMLSERSAFKLEEDQLARLKGQLKNCNVRAPQGGMVVYANNNGRRSDGPEIEEGAQVREGQTLIKLPDLTQMQVRVTVHESKVDRLQPGMRAEIKIQDRRFHGQVNSIANQPEQTSFFSANIKEYSTIVRIDGEAKGLRPGMTAEVEILVANLQDVLSVPVQAVVEQGGDFFCWVKTRQGPQRRPVAIGATNNAFIEIKDGLVEGDEVLLNPRAAVPGARQEVEEDKGDINTRFGGVPAEYPGQPVRRNAASGRPAAEENLSRLDKDGDGKVSLQEAPEAMRPHFGRIDTNGDGLLDAAEMSAARSRASKDRNNGGAASHAP